MIKKVSGNITFNHYEFANGAMIFGDIIALFIL